MIKRFVNIILQKYLIYFSFFIIFCAFRPRFFLSHKTTRYDLQISAEYGKILIKVYHKKEDEFHHESNH